MTRRVADVALWAAAAVGAVALIAAAVAAIFGFVPLVFTSGSMGPEIPAGSLGIAHSVSAGDIGVGDVVSVDRADGARVTHRVVSVQRIGDDRVELTLKGDANERPDKESYQVTEADRIWFSIPWAGRLVTWLNSSVVIFLGGMLVAGVIMWLVFAGRGAGGDRDGPGSPGVDPKHKAAGAKRLAVVGMAVPGLLATSLAQPTAAAFNDLGGTVTTSAFAAHRVAQPSDIACATGLLGLLSMKISTISTDARYEYVARIYRSNGTQVGTTDYLLSDVSGSAHSRTFTSLNTNLGLLDLGTVYNMRVYAHIPGTSWFSTEFRTRAFNVTGALGIPLAFNCQPATGAPIIGPTKPVNNDTGKTAGTNSMQDQIEATCEDGTFGGSHAAACGTASDDGSVTSVQYILQRTGGTLGVRCWNGGSLWVTNCAFRTAKTNAALTKWSVPRATGITSPYISDGAFTLTIRSTDNSGNVSESSINFTVTY